MVMESLAGAMDMAQKALAMFQAVGETDSSFARYFAPGQGMQFQGVLQLVLAFLGAPNAEHIRACELAGIPRLHFIYGDHPLTPKDCTYNKIFAAQAWYIDANGEKHPSIKFCPDWFNVWRGHKVLGHLVHASFVKPFGEHAGFPDPNVPGLIAAGSGASILLHGELFITRPDHTDMF